MDYALSVLNAFSANPRAAGSKKQLDNVLRDEVLNVKQLLSSHGPDIAANLGQILPKLNPAQNSIGFLAVIQTSLDHPPAGIERSALLDETLRFLLNFDPIQVRYIGAPFRRLLENVASGKVFSPLVAVEALSSALLRVDPSGSMFTSTHLHLAKLAYQTSWIEPALKVLDRDITFYPGMPGQKESRLLHDSELPVSAYITIDGGLTDPVKSSTVLEYNLVSGLCYIQRKDWNRAFAALQRAVTHPSRDRGVSKIMNEAYKKWVLVGLLRDGKEPTLPPYTPGAAKAVYNSLCSPYRSIASLFSTKNAPQLKAEAEGNRKIWEDDENLSLVNEVLSAYQKWQIINLRDIYKQISIPQLRRVTLSAETGETLQDDEQVNALVRGMIESHLLKGEVLSGSTAEETYLLFHDESALMTENEFAREIAERHSKVQSLGEQYKAANQRFSSSKEYVRHVAREQKRGDKEGSDPGIGFDSQIEDEDLMTGIMAHG